MVNADAFEYHIIGAVGNYNHLHPCGHALGEPRFLWVVATQVVQLFERDFDQLGAIDQLGDQPRICRTLCPQVVAQVGVHAHKAACALGHGGNREGGLGNVGVGQAVATQVNDGGLLEHAVGKVFQAVEQVGGRWAVEIEGALATAVAGDKRQRRARFFGKHDALGIHAVAFQLTN